MLRAISLITLLLWRVSPHLWRVSPLVAAMERRFLATSAGSGFPGAAVVAERAYTQMSR